MKRRKIRWMKVEYEPRRTVCKKGGEEKMNLEAVTVQDCLEMYKMKNCTTVINDGKVLGFEKEEILTTDRQAE